jgi:hypothetical protein
MRKKRIQGDVQWIFEPFTRPPKHIKSRHLLSPCMPTNCDAVCDVEDEFPPGAAVVVGAAADELDELEPSS